MKKLVVLLVFIFVFSILIASSATAANRRVPEAPNKKGMKSLGIEIYLYSDKHGIIHHPNKHNPGYTLEIYQISDNLFDIMVYQDKYFKGWQGADLDDGNNYYITKSEYLGISSMPNWYYSQDKTGKAHYYGVSIKTTSNTGRLSLYLEALKNQFVPIAKQPNKKDLVYSTKFNTIPANWMMIYGKKGTNRA